MEEYGLSSAITTKDLEDSIVRNAGILSFETKSDNIFNTTRYLCFGNHNNGNVCPKLLTSSGDFFLVTNIELAQNHIHESNSPGIILEIVGDVLEVSTLDNPVLVSFANLDGTQPLQYTYKDHHIYKGAKLSKLHLNTATLIHELLKEKEAFWRTELLHYEPTTFLRQRMSFTPGGADISLGIKIKRVVLPLPTVVVPSYFEDVSNYISTAFLAFIARICCVSTICVGILANKSYITNEFRTLYSDICPGVFHINTQDEMSTILKSFNVSLQELDASHSFLIDIFYRFPQLKRLKQTQYHNIVLGRVGKWSSETEIARKILNDCNVLFLTSTCSSEVHILYNEHQQKDFEHIQTVIQYFSTFLKSIAKLNGSYKLSDVSMVSDEDIEKLYPIAGFQTAFLGTPFTIFENQSRASQKNVALVSTQCCLSYEQCYNETVKLAKSIRCIKGLGNSKKVIALHLPNSISYVIAVLAIIHSDHAFLPLPLEYPEERLTFSLQDTDVKFIIMTTETYAKSHFSKLSSDITYLQLIGDENLCMLQIKSKDNDCGYVKSDAKIHKTSHSVSDDICYVMYTSGSTGRPKGVQVTKTGVVNLAKAQIQLWTLNENDIIAQFASIGFDATISEIFTALFCGATLAVFRENERLGQEFIVTMNKLNVNTITLPPSVLNVYKPTDLPYLKNVITAGEPCTLNTAVKWTSTKSNIKFFNAYGTTETTVCATNYQFSKELNNDYVYKDIPIGKAIPGVNVYLFDKFLKPVPPDVVGEIYIGGLGLSTGYIGYASHYNDDQFIQNPITKERMLLYKTGDHAYQDSNGTLTYVGRLDDMVKIRGQRVDLSEIERALLQHTQIDIAVVVLHNCRRMSERSIAAYVSPAIVYASELREYLSNILPKYMIPTYIKSMEGKDYPLTINGKIDRKRLQKDESIHKQHNIGSGHLNDIQVSIAKLWCQIFELDEVFLYSFRCNTSFKELGGNSLHLVLLQRQLEENLNIKLSFTDLSTADTIEEFGDVIKGKKNVLRKSSQRFTENEQILRQLILNDVRIGKHVLNFQKKRKGNVEFQDINTNTTKCNLRYPENILISGVTGFLGAYLLMELLEQTNSNIYCLVRGASDALCLDRIVENMKQYDLWKMDYLSRISVVVSDLLQENLGIHANIYSTLSKTIDIVFINAAMVNFNANYEAHRATNVSSTKEFIKFAMTGKKKFIFHTSSLSVFLFPSKPKDGEPRHKVYYESDFFNDPCEVEGGYGQSKWASEKIVIEALDYLPGGAIFRPARISGSALTGKGPAKDLFALILLSMQELGYYPDLNFPFDLTPVDYCAKAMIEIAVKIYNEPNTHQNVYHLYNSKTFPFRDMFYGLASMPLPLDEWRNKLKSVGKECKELLQLEPFFMSPYLERASYWPVFDCTNTEKMISQKTKDLMLHSTELLSIYRGYLNYSG